MSLNFALAIFAVGVTCFTIFFIRHSMADPDIQCITCGKPVYQDYAGQWKHDRIKDDLNHPAIPRKVN